MATQKGNEHQGRQRAQGPRQKARQKARQEAAPRSSTDPQWLPQCPIRRRPLPHRAVDSPPNPLQTTLGKIAMLLKQVAAQNTSVQEPLNAAVQNIVQAIQMSAQQGPSAPQQAPAPMQQ